LEIEWLKIIISSKFRKHSKAGSFCGCKRHSIMLFFDMGAFLAVNITISANSAHAIGPHVRM